MFVRPATGWPVDGALARWGVPSAMLGLFGAQLFSVVWFVVVAGSIYGSDDLPAVDERPMWTLLAFNLGLWLAYLAAPIIAHRMTQSRSMADFEFRAAPAELFGAAVIGVGAQLAVLPLLYVVVLWLGDGDPGRSAEQLVDRVDGPLDVTALVVAVVVIAPIVEEWFYRGMLLPALTRSFTSMGGQRRPALNGMLAAAVSSAVFAAVHQELILLPGLFVFGMILSWLTISTGRLGPAILAHMAFNATTVVQLLVFAGT